MKISHVHTITSTPVLTGHRLYKMAKNGHQESAGIMLSEIIRDKHQFHNLSGYVCPVSKQSGNRIPNAFANIMAVNSDLILHDDIFLHHTSHGSSMVERLYYQPVFSGSVKQADYVIVDDVYTSGKTLKALKNYIEYNGGNVTSAWTIGAGPSREFEPKRMLIRQLTAKFPNISRYFDLNELTSPQIVYLLRLSSLNRLWTIHADKQLSLFHTGQS